MDRICDNCMSRVPADSDKCTRCGIRFENTNPGGALPNGWVLGGRYTVGRYVDIDGEGVIYSAIDGDTLQRVTIKEYMPVTLCATRDEYGAIVAKPGNEVLFKTTRMDFRDLYDTLMRMGLTEGLVQVLDVLEENNTAYAVLEKVEGPTLAEYLTKADAPIAPARAMAVLRPVMNGVEAMHAANLVHRGISPDNIILESGGTAKLCGYAILALRQQGSELKPKLYSGYTAPEQYSASEFEGRFTDVYALGAVLYRMITGEVPQEANERRIQDSLKAARAVNKEIPTFLSTGIARAMRLVPEERLQTISDLRLALTGEGAKESKALPFGLSKQQLVVGSVALGAIVLILIIVLLVVTLGGGSGKPESSSSTTTSFVQEFGTVPNFVGFTEKYIKETYKDDDEYTFIWEEEYSNDQPEGKISSQSPAAGTDWNGGPITLYVSQGENPDEFKVKVPDVVKLTEAQAKQQLEALKIEVTREEVDNDGSYEAGQVVRTHPENGTEIDYRDTKVVLYVAGEKPLTMIDITGDNEETGRRMLEATGFKVSDTVNYVDNDGSYVPGTVVSTNVAIGQPWYPSGSPVVLNLAKDVTMPNLVGMSRESAENTLKALAESNSKVTVTVNIVEQEASLDAGLVFNTTPGNGGTIKNGDVVTLYVSKAAEVVSTPDPTPPPSEDNSDGVTE